MPTLRQPAEQLRVLIVEDSDDDAWLIIRELERAGLATHWTRVQTEPELREALRDHTWDVLICDYRLPHFSAPAALLVVQESERDVPFIVVSGTVGEDLAVDLMRRGAHDYLSKDNLTRLAPAVSREVQEAAVRHARRLEAASHRLYAQAGVALGTSLHYEDTLRTATSLGVPEFADACGLEVCGTDGEVSRLGDRAVFGAADAALLDAPRIDGAILSVPLMVRGARTGTLVYARRTPQRWFVPGDLPIAQELAQRVSVAIDNARLFEAEQAAREEAQAAVQARDEFLSIAAHELRTPITAIRGGVQLLLRRLGRGDTEPDRLKHSLDMLDQSSQRLTRLTDDLLDVVRLQTGQMNLNCRALDLNAFVESLAEQHRDSLPERFTLDVVLESVCPALVDQTRLEQVVVNLVTNAVKYSPHGGRVTLRTRAANSGVQIEVEDEGIGLPDDRLELIFEPFARAPNAAARQIPGMGLGLHISRQIVERHGGRIWASSPGEGQGTTFYTWLPCAALPDG